MAIKQLSDKNPDGTVVGQSAADLVAFHGATPVAQASAITTLALSATTTSLASTVNSILAVLANKGLTA
jgi:hypothetical protein